LFGAIEKFAKGWGLSVGGLARHARRSSFRCLPRFWAKVEHGHKVQSSPPPGFEAWAELTGRGSCTLRTFVDEFAR
jgi:hypothetical protein